MRSAESSVGVLGCKTKTNFVRIDEWDVLGMCAEHVAVTQNVQTSTIEKGVDKKEKHITCQCK